MAKSKPKKKAPPKKAKATTARAPKAGGVSHHTPPLPIPHPELRLLPDLDYPVASDRLKIPERFNQILHAESLSLPRDRTGRMFLAAANQKFVLTNPRGLENLLSWHGQGLKNGNGITDLGKKVAAGEEPFAAFWDWTLEWTAKDLEAFPA